MKALRFAATSALIACTAAFAAHCGEASEPFVDAGVAPPDELWGFADLHAHLAFHLAYGADLDGGGPGLMWGKPGMALDAGTVDGDLAPCNATHDSKDGLIAGILLPQLAQVLGSPHGDNGYPTFDNWPLATAGLHQQMHVTWLRRAYDGGQRLMVASAVENALLAAAFSGILSAPADGSIHVNELAAVRAQLAFIRAFVDANSDWLAIAKTSDEAGNAIRANKMAIVLGTECDTLSKDDIIDLFDEDGVRVFIPIHLADNDLGGTAVYEPMFDIHNAFVRGVGYAIDHDPDLEFKLALDIPPTKLLGLPFPNPTNHDNDKVAAPHRNKIGLTDAGRDAIHAMIEKGAIIDVAHMSQLSIDDTLKIAEGAHVPVIDSHTSVRPASEHAFSERDLRFDAAARIGGLGGMIGFGTSGITGSRDTTQARTFFVGPFGKLTPGAPTFTAQLPQPAQPVQCKGLSIDIGTADDDIREGSFGELDVTVYPDPTKLDHDPTQTFDLNKGFHVDNHQHIARFIPLPENTLASQVDVVLHHETHNECAQTADKWNVGSVTVTCGPRSFEWHERPKTLEGSGRIEVAVSTTDTSATSSVMVDVWTGNEHLDGSNALDVEVHTTAGTTTACKNVLDHHALESKTLRRIQCVLPSAVPMNQIDKVLLYKHGSDGKWDVAGVVVGLAESSERSAPYLDVSYSPPLELKSDPILVAPRTLAQRMVRLTIRSDAPGLESGIEATATFQFDSGAQTFPLNKGATLTGGKLGADGVSFDVVGSTYQFFVILDGEHRSSDIRSLRIDAPNITSDWPISLVVLEAFEEPVERWVYDLDQLTHALNRRTGCFFDDGRLCGVALGTDLNGMAPGIPGTVLSPYDPLRPGEYVLDYLPALGKQPMVAGRLMTGPTKKWDVMSDGIAHVGMLPDFLVAAAHAKQDNAANIVATIFHSAGDFVRMWRKIEDKSAAPPDAGSE